MTAKCGVAPGNTSWGWVAQLGIPIILTLTWWSFHSEIKPKFSQRLNPHDAKPTDEKSQPYGTLRLSVVLVYYAP